MTKHENSAEWGEPQYVRELLDPGGSVVTVRMWEPRPDDELPPFSIAAFQVMLPESTEARIHCFNGVDHFQALILTLNGIQIFLDRFAPGVTFDGMSPMSHGFPEFRAF